MRLIDADDFFARMENDTDLCAEMEADGLRTLKKYLDMQPTAYSVDKIVEEFSITRNELIEIVKHGCVSDNVCEWKQ